MAPTKQDVIDIIIGLFLKDKYECYIWLTWLAEKVDCKDCINLYKSKGKRPDCYNNCIPSKNLIKSRYKSGKKEK